METYFDNKKKEICNGCGTCYLVCPNNCIKMIEDEEGFLYPQINESDCIKCNKCKNTCGNFPKENTFNIKIYAAKNKNNLERKNSTSGGIFYILARYVIEKEGIVFGVKYDECLNIKHDYSDTLDKCKDFSISKYVRSDLENSYIKVKEFLNEDRHVLFTGTPCQVYGLKVFLGKEYNKLILCEIICHSNPSPKVFRMYIKNKELVARKKIHKIYFRSKNVNVCNKPYIEYEDGTIEIDDLFNKAFLANLISRPSCNSCSFVGTNRKSDFTIGDFWGVDTVFEGFNDGQGVSLVTVNSEKASYIFDKIKDKLDLKESDLKTAFKYNHNHNLSQHKKRKEFFDKIAKKGINEMNIIYNLKKYTKVPLMKKVIKKIMDK